MIFEERIGCFNDPMPEQAREFIENLCGFFKTMQPLMYNMPIYKIYEHKGWKVFEKYTDELLRVGLEFVNKVCYRSQIKNSIIHNNVASIL